MVLCEINSRGQPGRQFARGKARKDDIVCHSLMAIRQTAGHRADYTKLLAGPH